MQPKPANIHQPVPFPPSPSAEPPYGGVGWVGACGGESGGARGGIRRGWGKGGQRGRNLETELVYMECLLELSYGPQNIETANFSTCILIRWGFRDAIERGGIVFADYWRAKDSFSISSSPLLVLGEYDAADGKFSASYLQRHIQMMKLLRYHYFLGKFCDGHIVYLLRGSL
ncbi:hypothetical protein Pint_19492 [Pistacia integerrima]|uniref:Uncharacterized protein n=1 Tax=Pistacia integerrima TaxID=434235 RepID=A0ACC0Z0G1_9ROSI|nr:hypothetical protein Pint_19492 [Pistacia integerrima]